MSSNDRTIILVIPLIAAVIAFWFLLISPKREEAKQLETQITQLQDSVRTQEAAVQAGEAARKSFPRDYHRLVVLGKAVPVDDETASFLVQVQRIADQSGVEFQSINAGGGAGAAPPATTAAPATEGAAAQLPIGATVGTAGLPIMPYTLKFTKGNFFQIADFMAGVDRLVQTHKGRIASDGRLVTIDSFDLSADGTFPTLAATLEVTTYVAPANQGLTGGATPAGPSTTTPVAAPATTTAPTTPTSTAVPAQ